jgi:tetratricopeptide (TPR) repeat protein
LELKDKGDYTRVEEVMRPLWKGLGERPHTKGLHASVSAEVLFCIGILTSWIGGRNEIRESQELAKNLISESITFYESVGDAIKVATARAEIAYCYWREGAFDEARILLSQALQKLTVEGNTRARAILRLSIVEWSDSRHSEALKILTEHSSLFEKITSQVIKGGYHSQKAIIFRHLAKSEKTAAHLSKAIEEFEKADHHFKLAKNTIFRADVKNNVGLILSNLSRFSESHECLLEARRLSVVVRDRVRTAQFDESRAQVYLAERKFKEAEIAVRSAVQALEKSGQQCLLADALITQGIALARLERSDQAQFTFQKAIEVAHQVGALNKAGLAALTLVEELGHLPAETLTAAYNRASEWLANSQSQEILLRLNSAARKVLLGLRGEVLAEEATQNLLNKPCDLQAEVLRYEGVLISQALGKVSGSVTRAAALLGMSYQGLAYVIESRHKDLLKERSPIRRRVRKD